MAVVPDPHFNIPGNKQTGEAVTPVGTKYRMLFPVHAPFFTTSLVVKSGGKTLKLGDDYVITHPYMTGMERTGYLCHGAVWITNDKYVSNFTMDYHPIGIAEATPAQVTAERELNKDKFPTDNACQWDVVVGTVYFPPVDILFDWENWRGELELMQAIADIGTKIGQLPPIPDPYVGNIYAPAFPDDIMMNSSRQYVTYDNQGGYVAKSNGSCVVYLSSNDYLLKNYQADTTYALAGYATNVNAKQWWSSPLGYLGPGYNLTLEWDSTSLVMKFHITIKSVSYILASFAAPKAWMGGGFRVQFDRSYDADTVAVKVTGKDGTVKMDYKLDFHNPPSELTAALVGIDIIKLVHKGVDFRNGWYVVKGDSWRHTTFPGMTVPDGSDVLTLLKQYQLIVDKLYRDAPAHTHIPRKDNPHRDTWGPIRALELNGIASDATLAYGKTQPQLADYVNNLLPKLSSLANKLLRMPTAAQAINGTFGTKPGLTSVTSAVGTDESGGVGAQFTVDPRVIRFLGRDSTTVNAGNNAITFQGGTNQLVLYPDSRGLLWNGKKLLDPTTVGPYLPGNEGGGDNLFYGTTTATVTINGNGIQSVPFICTFVPPTSEDLGLMAVRMLANDFGNAENLAATPALIAKLDALFTGKLVGAKSYVNDMPLTGSIYIDKTNFNLNDVQDIPDAQLPISTLQQAELDKYAVVGHSHNADAFGIKAATTTTFGLVQFGLAVDDATLALDGSEVIRQTTTITDIETVAKTVDSGAAINIIRYGRPGTETIENGITYTGWMATIKANTYFVGLEYDAPLATFNMAEVFPDTHEDNEFGVFVDVQGNDAKYLVLENPNTAETETMTKIGTIVTSEDGIVAVEIHNVTRLGEFRELEDHIANDNAHIKRKLTQEQFGFTYGSGGPVWASGVPGLTRFEGDWRYATASNYRPMSKVTLDDKASKWTFQKTGIGAGNYGFIHHTFPMFTNNGITHTWLSSVAAADSVFESLIGAWHDSKTSMKRISIVFARTAGRITTTSAQSSYAGLAVNYGNVQHVLIGFEGLVGSGANWDVINPSVQFSHSRQADGILFKGTVSANGGIVDFELLLSSTAMTLKHTLRSTGQTWTVDLSTRLRPDYIDVTKLINDPNIPVYQGMGGLFGEDASVLLNYTNVNNLTVKNRYYATFLDYALNYSALYRARYFEGMVANGSNISAMNNYVFNQVTSADKPADPAKMFFPVHPCNMLTYDMPGASSRTVIIRD